MQHIPSDLCNKIPNFDEKGQQFKIDTHSVKLPTPLLYSKMRIDLGLLEEAGYDICMSAITFGDNPPIGKTYSAVS
jgi:hypothetical protein